MRASWRSSPNSAADAVSESPLGNLAVGATAGINLAGDANIFIGGDTGGTGGAGQTGDNNIAIGYKALEDLTTASSCVAVGAYAGSSITTGVNNFALGSNALALCAAGTDNVGIGNQALYSTTGSSNVGIGSNALVLQTAATGNVAIGANAGDSVTDGSVNVFVGAATDLDSAAQRSGVTVVGASSTVDGDFSTALGYSAHALAHGSVAIGTDSGGAGASTLVPNEIKLGTPNHTVHVPGALDLPERAAPVAPGANFGRIFCQDNGSGKSQLCVRFATGAIQVIATEP